MMRPMQIVVCPQGDARCVYGEAVDLACLGEVAVRRASHVEPDERGQWRADLSPVGGPVLGPFARRSEALEAEEAWLAQHWLIPTGLPRHLPRHPSLLNPVTTGQTVEGRCPCAMAERCSR